VCAHTGLAALGKKNDPVSGLVCKYIVGEVRSKDGWAMCGRPAHKSSSWCFDHFCVVSDIKMKKIPQRMKPSEFYRSLT